MMGMNQLPMNYDEIKSIMNQNPMIKNMVYTLIKNPMIMNQMMNIINVLYYNPLLLEQIKNSMTQEIMMNNQMLNMMNGMNNGGMMNNFEDKQENKNYITLKVRNSFKSENPIILKCNSTDKVSTIIEKYRKESGDDEYTLKLVYNSSFLNPSITIGEARIRDMAYIEVIADKEVIGG